MIDYLLDTTFLKELDYQKEREIYLRITALTNDEYPREEIIGRATGGSINVDGASAIRRSCSISMLALAEDYLCKRIRFHILVYAVRQSSLHDLIHLSLHI